MKKTPIYQRHRPVEPTMRTIGARLQLDYFWFPRTARIQGDETAISFLRTYLVHIDAETLETLNAEYPKLEDKIMNLSVSRGF